MSKKLRQFLNLLRRSPLIASVQASPNSPLSDVSTLTKLACASANEGVRVLRAEGAASITAMHEATNCSIIGLAKRDYDGSPVRITPTHDEVSELLQTPCEVVALDATRRPRPDGVQLGALIRQAHEAGKLVLGDCDDLDSMQYAVDCGADMVASTLAGYTSAPSMERRCTNGPELELVRHAATTLDVPVLSEGRISTPAHVLAALRAGASGVVVGGGLNDPVKLTRRLLSGAMGTGGHDSSSRMSIGAFDIGGTWLRYGCFDGDWKLQRKEKVALPRTVEARAAWMKARADEDGISYIGVSTGGVVDPRSGVVTFGKEEIIPEHVGFNFKKELSPIPVIALNDGMAQAWAHACLPQFAGKRVATLALGTGVGCGFVDENMRLMMGSGGAYPQLNDLLAPVVRQDQRITSFERLMGGYHLGGHDGGAIAKEEAKQAAMAALASICQLWLPDVVVIAGGVGLGANLLQLNSEFPLPGGGMDPVQVVPSPLGEDAGLYAAAALALFNPHTMF